MLGHRIVLGTVNRAVLRSCWHAMMVFLEEFFDVSQHRNVEGSCRIIPLQFYSTVKVARRVFGDAVIFLDACDKVIGVFFSNVFYAKIVNH